MSAAVPFNPMPVAGDIVWTKFPQVENLGSPGPKPRPALILFLSDEDHAVIVAYGTTQRTDKVYPGEFVLDPQEPGFSLSGLTARTKFDLGRTVQLPFDSNWFDSAPGVHINSPLPKMGTLHPSYMQVAADAYGQVN